MTGESAGAWTNFDHNLIVRNSTGVDDPLGNLIADEKVLTPAFARPDIILF